MGLLAVPRARPASVRTSSWNRTSSAPTGVASSGIQSDVRWSGSTRGRGRPTPPSAPARRADPRRWSTVTVGPAPGSTSTASLMSESTRAAGRTGRRAAGPARPAASTAKRCPSTSRTPAASGSMPRACQARSRKESAGSTTTSTSPAAARARSSDTVRSATRGEPGHGVQHLAVGRGLGHEQRRRCARRRRRTARRRRRRRRSERASPSSDAGRVATGAQEADRGPLDGGEGAGGDEVGSGRAEADDGHPAARRRPQPAAVVAGLLDGRRGSAPARWWPAASQRAVLGVDGDVALGRLGDELPQCRARVLGGVGRARPPWPRRRGRPRTGRP